MYKWQYDEMKQVGIDFTDLENIEYYDSNMQKIRDFKLYRLIKVPIVSYNEYDALEIAACKNKYSPDIIDGEVIEDNSKEIHIGVDRIDGNNYNWQSGVYKFQKNTENFKFWDITDKFQKKQSSNEK